MTFNPEVLWVGCKLRFQVSHLVFMKSHRPISLFAMVLCMSACSTMTEVKLYDGQQRDSSQVTKLYLDPHVTVTQVDNIREHPTDKSRVLAHSAGKRREYVALAPGPHELSARFFILCLHSDGEFPLVFNAEPGKKYRLKSVVDAEIKKWKPEIIEYDGAEIEDDFPWMRAMCPVNVQIIWLKR